MFKFIDNFLNKITMYSITLYSLLFLWCVGLILNVFKVLHYNPVDFIITGVLIFSFCFLINYIFSLIFKVPSNSESVYITALILALIISPSKPFNNLDFIFFASLIAAASKYIIAINKKHIFNPAALGVFIASLMFNKYASWWTGTFYMAPFALIAGFLIVRKLQRESLVLSFLITSVSLIAINGIIYDKDILFLLKQLIIDSPLIFLGTVMLTEPMTTPPKNNLRIIYGTMVGVLFLPFFNIAGFYFSPELAILTGNIFSYLVSPKHKIILTLKEKIKSANSVYDFIFEPSKKFNFIPGQYMEWTLWHKSHDQRGVRRYFTIASSPTEKDVILGVKFYEKPSSYKKTMDFMKVGDKIIAGQLAGDFTLPRNKNKKLVFLAGGIGVTPFRSMIKYLLDNKEKRDIIMYYSNKSFADIAYEEIFSEAQRELGIKTIHVLNDENGVPENFSFKKGPINMGMIKKDIPDYKERIFYISGPKAMVDSFKLALKELGVKKSNIKTDFFPGFT